MKDPIEERVNKWAQNGEEKFSEINLKIIHLDQWLFSDYEPALGHTSNFLKRLAGWLSNLNDEDDQKTLFELVPNLFYIGREELNVLYREAYHTVFCNWLVDQIGVNFSSPDVLYEINKEVGDTWFCPLTDSLRINQFYHINNIPGKHDHRPDWRSLRSFGDVKLIKDYIVKKRIKRIVLLEDFIGNGGQISKAVTFVAENFSNLPILILPLIICPKGMSKAIDISKSHSNIQVKPVIVVSESHFIHEDILNIHSAFFKKVHALAEQTYEKVSDSQVRDDNIDPYGPFGWRKTGGLIVMHTNTPNNSLPLIHNGSKNWMPLFKRHKRI